MLRVFIPMMILLIAAGASADPTPTLFHVDVHAPTRAERGELAQMGFDLEGVDLANGIAKLVATIDDVRLLQSMGYAVDYTQADFPANMADYHNAQETDDLIDDWAADYPDIVHVFSLGDSIEGRPIRVVKISDNADTDEDEPGFLLMARHHAREPLSSELALETIRRLLETYETDPYTEWLVNEREIFVIPRHNPDGAAWDEEQGLVYWRKNRRQNAGQPAECWGVDTNRNYGYQWGLDQGSSGDPCSDVYRGTAAFSEPETALTKAFLEANTNITTLITLHTYGNMILYPWGYTSSPIGDETDRAIFQAMAARFRDFNGYTTGPGNSLYPISGDTVDWAWGALGLFAFTFEVSNTDYGFYPPDQIFDVTYYLNYPALEMAAGLAGDPSMALNCGLWLFEGESLGDAAKIAWAPIVETDGAGYEVLRSEAEDGTYISMTPGLVATGQDGYELQDGPATDAGDASSATYTYWYKIRFTSNNPSLHREFGPISVTVDAPLPTGPTTTTSTTSTTSTTTTTVATTTTTVTTTTAASTTTTTTIPPDDDADDTDDDAQDDDAVVPGDDTDDPSGYSAGETNDSSSACGC